MSFSFNVPIAQPKLEEQATSAASGKPETGKPGTGKPGRPRTKPDPMEEIHILKGKVLSLTNALEKLSPLVASTPMATQQVVMPTIQSIDPMYQREIERQRIKLKRQEYKKIRKWIEIKNGKKTEVTQVYYEYPDGAIEKGNKYQKYLGKATPAESVVIIKD